MSESEESQRFAMEVYMSESNSNLKINVTLRAASKPGAVKAYADVRVFSPLSFKVSGVSVVHHDPQKPAWVSYPQRAGKDGKKYFATFEPYGVLDETIRADVLREFERMRASNNGGAVPRAQIPREQGDDSIPF